MLYFVLFEGHLLVFTSDIFISETEIVLALKDEIEVLFIGAVT